MKLVLLGTGTPNACPNASGPSAAVIINNKAYIVDFGPGIVRQASKAYFNGINELRPDLLTIAFCTHLHSDHTAGLSDLILTPWVLERAKPLELYGPTGIDTMADHIIQAYQADIQFRINGFEHANKIGYLVNTHIISAGFIYADENISVEAIPVSHGGLESYAFKFYAEGKTILISGDTCPLDIIKEKAKNCNILVHEVEYSDGLKDREEKWQIYHREVHTLSKDLAQIAIAAKPGLIVTIHRIYHMNIYNHQGNLSDEIKKRDQLILDEIKDEGYMGNVINGHDLDVFDI